MFDPGLTNMLVHDLKNPLAGITTTSELFMDGTLGALTAEQKKFMANIRLAGKMLTILLMDIQDVSNFENDSATLDKATFPVGDLPKDLAWLNDFAVLEEKKLEITVKENISILADRRIVVRMLEDLVLNALKQSSRGGQATLRITESSEALRSSKSEEGAKEDALRKQVLFEVTDSGDGLPKELSEKIFNRDFKVVNPKLKSKAGAGVGLYFCRLAAKAHGGAIGAEGSKFFFTLPT